MWARSREWGEKYHWYKPGAYPLNYALCHVGPALTTWDYQRSTRTQPRHADRCKLCVRALKEES